MTASICWIHIGDLHMDEADGWRSRERLDAIVAEVNGYVGHSADMVYLPGDNANHATVEQYRNITDSLALLRLPWRVIPGDHDFEMGDLANYEAGIPVENRPEVELVAGHRCIFLDIVSAGSGGPDFRLTAHHRNRLMHELARADAEGQIPLVFMHAYPGDLAVDSSEIARILADARVAFVDTGHTHYSELLNDGRVIYGATRSTGQIEEGEGKAGFSIVCVHDRVPSWRFRELDAPWPHVQIVSPCDLRLVTRPSDPRQVPRPGTIAITAKLIGRRSQSGMVVRNINGRNEGEMWRVGDVWRGDVQIDAPGLHRIEVACGAATDRIDLLVRGSESTPKRALPVALGRDCHAVGSWPAAGIEGTQLGPNKNGGDW